MPGRRRCPCGGGKYLKSLFGAGAPAAALANTASASAEAAAPSTLAAEPRRWKVTVYVTRTGERYHRGSRRHLRRSSYAMSLSDAKLRGYTPCKVCRPAG